MKKFLCAILALAMCAVLLTSAMAEFAQVTEFKSDDAVSWVSNGDVLSIRTNSGSYMAALDGTALTENIYYSLAYEKGIVIALKNGAEGINSYGGFLADGTLIMPFEYGNISGLNENWAVGVTFVAGTAEEHDYSIYVVGGDDIYANIERADIYNLASKTCVATLTREQYKRAEAFGEYINIQDRNGDTITYDATFNPVGEPLRYIDDNSNVPGAVQRFSFNGKTGLKDSDDNVVMAPEYDIVFDFYDGCYAMVELDGQRGLVDIEGNLVVPTVYDDMILGIKGPADPGTSYNNVGYFCVEKDGMYGFVRAGGEVTCEPAYAKTDVKVYGASLTFEDSKGVTHIVAGDGVETVLDAYERYDALNGCYGYYYSVTNADGLSGVIDFHGNVIVPCEHKSVRVSGSGKYLLTDTNYGLKMGVFEINYPDSEASAPATDAEPAEVDSADADPTDAEPAEADPVETDPAEADS